MDYNEIKNISDEIGLSVKAILIIQNEMLISEPVKEIDIHVLRIISQLWKNERFLSSQLSQFKFSERIKLVLTADFNRLEKYIYNRYLSHYCDESRMTKCITVKQIVDELIFYYKLPETKRKELVSTVYIIRKKFYNTKLRYPELLSKIDFSLDSVKRLKRKEQNQIKRDNAKRDKNKKDIFGYK